MQLSSVNDVKIYNLSHGKSLPEVRKVFSFCFLFLNLARKPRYLLNIAKRASLDSRTGFVLAAMSLPNEYKSTVILNKSF